MSYFGHTLVTWYCFLTLEGVSASRLGKKDKNRIFVREKRKQFQAVRTVNLIGTFWGRLMSDADIRQRVCSVLGKASCCVRSAICIVYGFFRKVESLTVEHSFSAWEWFAPQGYWLCLETFLVVTTESVCEILASSGHEPGTPLNTLQGAQHSSRQQRIVQPQMPVMPRLRTLLGRRGLSLHSVSECGSCMCTSTVAALLHFLHQNFSCCIIHVLKN